MQEQEKAAKKLEFFLKYTQNGFALLTVNEWRIAENSTFSGNGFVRKGHVYFAGKGESWQGFIMEEKWVLYFYRTIVCRTIYSGIFT